MYLLLSSTAFRLPTDPGPIPVYYGHGTPIVNANRDAVMDAQGNPTFHPIDCAMQATIEANFARSQNYWLLYQNVKQACYNVLNESIDDTFKFSNNPNLTGWNQWMGIMTILDQMVMTYGCPTPNALLQNDTLFQSVYSPNKSPEASSIGLKAVRRSRRWGMIHTPQRSS